MGHAPDHLISHLRHLAARFFDVLRARPLTPDEQRRVSDLLHHSETPLFWAQPLPDQRHGLAAADRIGSSRPERTDLQRAALLHDVAKRHARLGVLGRVAASLTEILHLPARGRIAAYLDHGPLGAQELAAAGSERLIVEFTRAHHGARPESIPAEEWDLLIEADH